MDSRPSPPATSLVADRQPGGEKVTSRPKLIPFRGVLMPDIFLENWEEVEEFPASPDDLLIATYPKAGTTWLQEMVDAIFQDGQVERCGRDKLTRRIPFLECKMAQEPRQGLQFLSNMVPPRAIKTHLPFNLIPSSFLKQGCKMIYCARNAKDVLVSYYHFDRMNHLQPDPGSWEEYFQRFLDGEVSYGRWDHHVLGWWDQRQKIPLLYLFYEDMKEDPGREVEKVATFLGKVLPPQALDAIVDHTSFESMRRNEACNYSNVPTHIFNANVSAFMRKGQVGDWRHHFTVAQNERFDVRYAEWMGDTDLRFRTEL